MPFTTTFATLSARGFGLFGKKLNLTTVTFPSGTTTWTAPPGVSNLVVVVGKGADGVSDYTDSFPSQIGFLGAEPNYVTPGAYGTVDWSNPYSLATTLVSSGGPRQTDTRYVYWDIAPNNQSSFNGPYINEYYPNAHWVNGNVYIEAWAQLGGPLPPTSGQMLFSYLSVSGIAGWRVFAYMYIFGYPGANTTAFGLTFPGGAYSGGTGYPATDTTFTNVAVIPGTTYTIVNNGSLTIQYYV